MWFNRHSLNRVIVGSAVLLISWSVDAQTTWHVDDDNCPGPGSGTLKDPFCSIQDGIDAAVGGDEVVVADGTYTGPGNRDMDFGGKLIAVRSANGPDTCIIDCQGDFADPHRGFLFHNAETAAAMVQGFTITNGYTTDASPFSDVGGGMYISESSPTVVDCVFSNNTAGSCFECSGFGGGMFNVNNSSPTISNCTFIGNLGFKAGGGMYNDNSSPTVTNCTFGANTTAVDGDGAGMYNLHSSPTVTNCTFSANIALNGEGGGMYNAGILTSPTVINCTFTGNSASAGGGMSNRTSSSPTVTNCTFAANSANIGGGMSNRYNGSPTVTNCTFTGNTATVSIGAGGGMYNERNGSPTVTNCTFTGNTASGSFGGGGGMYSTDEFGGHATPTLYNCILWGNDPDEIVEVAGAVTTASYSDVQDGWFGLGRVNIDADPMFVDAVNGNYRLSPGSPCIDAANNWGVPIDADDVDQDANVAELFPVDLDGNPRFNADEADFDPGCGIPVVVDMGAYEYQFDPVEDVIYADLNGDGVVGVLDLLGVLAAWGDAANNCTADLDIDGDVGILDLLTLLAHWG